MDVALTTNLTIDVEQLLFSVTLETAFLTDFLFNLL